MSSIIHIGGNKTASTALQRRLFSKHPAIRYLGEDCQGYAELRPLLDSLVNDDDSYFDFVKTKQSFSDRFDGPNGSAVCVYSNEDIMTSFMPSVCAQRLKVLLPDAHVVMVIRSQLTTWPSWYANHGAYLKNVPRRFWRMHVALEDWLDYCFDFPKKTPVEAMNYERFLHIFRDTFSAERVHVFLYEELIKNPSLYYQHWAKLLGIPLAEILECMANHVERGRHSGRRVFYDRWTSKLSVIPGFKMAQKAILRASPIVNRWLDSGPPAKIELPLVWKNRISDYYRQSNARMAKMTGLDLASHGYPL